MFLVDRNLGRRKLPDALRTLGFEVLTLADVYGEHRAQETSDQEWIERAGKENWVVLTKDDRIRYRRVEREAFVAANLRVLCLTNANLRGDEQIERFVGNIDRIVRRSLKPGPYIFGVYRNGLRRIWPTVTEMKHMDGGAGH